MKNKKLIVILPSVMILLFVILVAIYINYTKSVQYATYQVTIAQKTQNPELALKYYNIDEIIDTKINNLISELTEEEMSNPFMPMGISMITNMREPFKIKLEKELENLYTQEPGKLKEIN